MLDKISGDIMLSWGVKRFIIAFIAGALANFALPPFDFFAVLFISFPILVWLIDGASKQPDKGFIAARKPAFITGWSFGFGYFTSGLWWLGNAVLTSGEEAYWALPLAVFALPAVLAIFYGLAVVLARTFWDNSIGRIFALSASFGALEYLRATVFTGFPWNTIGYAGMPVPLAMQSSQIIGIFGMSIITVFTASVPALLATKKGLKPGFIIAGLMIAAHIGYGIFSLSKPLPENSGHILRIVQPSIDQTEKWDDEKRAEIFKTYLRLSAEPPAENQERPSVIIWPETSVPFILTKTPDALSQIADTLKIGQTLITGAVRLEESASGEADKYYNTVYVINDEGQITGSADKHHLVPFGEYLPFESLLRSIGLTPIAETFGGFTGASKQRILELGNNLKLLPLICYEAIFPKYSQTDELGLSALINLTNDAWYGDTPGPHQHLRQAQLRSVETGLPLIRSGNNGISVVTDATGRIIDGLALNYVGKLDFELPGRTDILFNHTQRNLAFAILLLISFFIAFLFTRGSVMKS
ncbi:MAG: apolipoprotein N-acyltransferase [Lentilitoribacter sp.]